MSQITEGSLTIEKIIHEIEVRAKFIVVSNFKVVFVANCIDRSRGSW
jgi:hypothetical protein